jgi:hypothetical protein
MIDSAVSSYSTAPRSSPTGAEIRSRSAATNPTWSSPSRRAACVRREPIAPTNRAGERSASASAGTSTARSWLTTTIDVAESTPPRRATASSSPAVITPSSPGAATGSITDTLQPMAWPIWRRQPAIRPAPNTQSCGGGTSTSRNIVPRRSDISCHSISAASRAASSSSSGEPSEPDRRPPASTTNFAPGAAPASSVTNTARPSLATTCAARPGTYSSTHVSKPPPRSTNLAGAPSSTRPAASTTSPRTAPGKAPATSPSERTASFEPGPPPENRPFTSVASAHRSPAATHSDRTGQTALRSPPGSPPAPPATPANSPPGARRCGESQPASRASAVRTPGAPPAG